MGKGANKQAKARLGVSLILAGLIAVIFMAFVDMRPHISPDFFFGSDDPEIAETKEIARLFPAEEFLVISVGSPNIFSARYMLDVKNLTDRLLALPGFSRVISISNGPSSLFAAKESPFWRPLLITQDESATLILAFLSNEATPYQVPAAEEIATTFENSGAISGVYLSGMPYIVEQIRKSIVRDAKLFSTAVLVLFAVLLWGLYRAPMIALGASVSGVSAIFLTLITLQLLKQPVGILTANLAIIIFVLVQSQVIYLSNNWLREDGPDRHLQVRKAVLKTFPASFWCSVTTFLGFLSLLFVSAEPLRQLGLGGIVGVICALCSCYVVFPPFLYFAVRRKQAEKPKAGSPAQKGQLLKYGGAIMLVVWCIISLPGIAKLETDPSLFSYFKTGGDIETALSAIDQNGGSSPLQMVVSLKDGSRLDSEEAYKRLWTLHKSLSDIDQVGTVLSLPALMAEANDYPLAFLLPWREIITVLSLDANENAAENFLSDDRRQTLFLLRMKEADRTVPRPAVIAEVENRAQENGFRVDYNGGVYVLQARLATLVGSSITTGIVSLLSLFFVISYVITRNWRLSAAMFAAASMVPLISLGSIGYLSVPLDIISAPAISVALGLAVDALIHLALAVRRKQNTAESSNMWSDALAEQSGGIIASSGIIFLGFMVFSFSDFPPTTRFGVTVIAGALLAGTAALTFFPVVSKILMKRQRQ